MRPSKRRYRPPEPSWAIGEFGAERVHRRGDPFRDSITKRLDLSYKTQSYAGVSTEPTTWSSTPNALVFTKTRTAGPAIPGFKAKIARGEGATSVLSGTDFQVLDKGWISANQHGSKSAYPSAGTVYSCARFEGPPQGFWSSGLPSLPPPAEVVDKAKVSFVKRCREAQGAQMGTAIAEFHEVVSAVRHPLASMTKLLDLFQHNVQRRGRKLRVRTRWNRLTRAQRVSAINEMVAGTWLEFSFGWISTFRDLNSALETYLDPERFEISHWPVRAWGTDEDKLVSFEDELLGSTGWRCKYAVRKRTKYSVIFRGGLRLNADGYMHNPFAHYGITFSEFIPTLYNIIPYSFLVDMVSNLGDLIEAATFNRSQLNWVNWTTRADIEYVTSLRSYTPPGTTSGYVYDIRKLKFTPSRVATFKFVRDVYLASLVPSFRWNLPGQHLSSTINLSALLAQSRVTQSVLNNLL